MATSGQITGLLTARDCITTAMELLGTLAPGDDPTSEEMQSGVRYLNFMLKSWQSDGCNLWRDEDVEIVWPAGTPDCTLAPTIIDVVSARYVQSPTYERELGRFERGDYNALPNKLSSGAPTIFNFVRELTPKLRLWPVPSAECTIRCSVARVIEDVTAADQELDIPQEWTECAYYNLAARMANTMGTRTTSAGPAVVEDVKRRAAELYAQLSSFDRPGSVFFQPWR